MSPPVTLAALAALARSHPFQRKLLVCRRPAEGRELLRALAAGGCPWLGFEVTTLWQLAQGMVGSKLAALGLQPIDEFAQAALLDEAIERVLSDGATGRLAELAGSTGLRQAVAGAVQALRLAGIDAAMLGRTQLRDEEKRAQLARILTCYEELLRQPPFPLTRDGAARLTDTAGTLRAAVASLRVGDVAPPDGLILLLPGHSRRGLAGELIDALLERGAVLLPGDPVRGLPAPAALLTGAASTEQAPAELNCSLAIFAATSVTAELREVLRRVLAAGLRWDQVEIIATDALTYGVALDELARRLGIPVTYAPGLPVSRTRPGRAVAGYLEWIAEGFPADVLRRLLERGDLALPQGESSGTRLARELRRLRVGRGRERYLAAIERARQLAPTPALAELEALLTPILAATPILPEHAWQQDAEITPAALARGVLALLAYVPCHDAVEHSAHERLRQRLQRIERTATRLVLLPAAIACLTTRLDARVPSPDAAGGAPWGAAGGHLHLSDVDQGGYTNRAATFIVGLDAGRFPGTGLHDALLVDDDRRRLTAEQSVPALPTAAERVEERRWAFAALLARLRGQVTLSYSTWDAVEGRALPPAAELLQAYRLLTGDVSADYEQLHAALAPAASPVPRAPSPPLDADDVWLGTLEHRGLLRYGQPLVRELHPGLDAGMRAGAALLGDALTAHHGCITPRPQLDPRANAELVLSASRLETLGTCPHRYLLAYVLGVQPPDDPELSPEQWLSARERGSLMHRVYQSSLTLTAERGLDVAAAEFERLVLDRLECELAAARELLPPPGEAIYELERDALREDARAFVAMVREDGQRWLLPLERRFGFEGEPPVTVDLPQGAIRLAGAIDRIDRLDDGRLVVIDYKTGSSLRYGEKQGTVDGGRRLQHVLYAALAERLEQAEVARAEYQFPTRRAENHRARYSAKELRAGLEVVDRLLVLIERGLFHPTNDREDCKYCAYAAVCRVRVNERGDVLAPLADWVRNSRLEELELLRELRR